MTGRLGKRVLFGGACAGTGLLVVALMVHATVRDTRMGWQIVFYATPWPVLAALAAMLAIYWARRGGRVWPALLVAVTVTTLGLWFWQGWCWAPSSAARGELRVVLWNVDRPDWRLPGTARWLLAQDADVMTIAERQPRKKDRLEGWRAAFPGYELRPTDGEMLCLVRGEVVSVEEGLLKDGSFGTLLRTRVRGHDLSILQVDISAAPRASRGKPLTRLAEIIAGHRGENLLVAGDFNTPLESAFMPGLRAEVANAFESVGRGCAATWPRPLPVLSLDQIWTNAGLRAVRCEHITSWRSDHRAVVAEFDFAR